MKQDLARLLELSLSKEDLRDAMRKARLPVSGTKKELSKKLLKETGHVEDVLRYLSVPALRSLCAIAGEDTRATRSEMISTLESSGGLALASPGSDDVERLTDLTIFDAIASHPRLVIEVFTPWCSFCQAMAPTFKRLAGEFSGDVKFAKLNGDHYKQAIAELRVKGYPTFLLFRDGQEAFRNADDMEPEELETTIRELLIR